MAFQDNRNELQNRAQDYAKSRSIQLQRTLGFGNDGAVWETSRGSAVKIEERVEGYERELSVYQRLLDFGVTDVCGFAIPELIDYEGSLLAIEMDVVSPPSILDFAKSYLDVPPDFSPEVLAEWQAEAEDIFESDWPVVQQILAQLRVYGIYYYDAKPGNVRFRV